MKTKKLIIGLITLLALLATIAGALADDFTQYTPSPTTNNIIKVETYNKYAMAVTTSATNYLFYNGSEWNEINPPANMSAYSFVSFDRATDGKFYFYYLNSTNLVNYRVLSYTPTADPNHNGWQIQITNTLPNTGVTGGAFACLHKDVVTNPKCLIALANDSFVNIFSQTSVPAQQIAYTIMGYDKFFVLSSGATSNRFNGVSWVNLGATGGALYSIDFASEVATATTASVQLSYLNSSTQTFAINVPFELGTTGLAINPTTDNVYIITSGNKVKRILYLQTNASHFQNQTLSDTPNFIEFSPDGNIGWIVGNTGIIYQYGAINQPSTSVSNATAYALQAHYSQDNNITNIVGVTPISASNAFAIAQKNGKLAIINYDFTITSNIVVSNYTTPYTRSPRGIDALGDTLTLATGTNALI